MGPIYSRIEAIVVAIKRMVGHGSILDYCIGECGTGLNKTGTVGAIREIVDFDGRTGICSIDYAAFKGTVHHNRRSGMRFGALRFMCALWRGSSSCGTISWGWYQRRLDGLGISLNFRPGGGRCGQNSRRWGQDRCCGFIDIGYRLRSFRD